MKNSKAVFFVLWILTSWFVSAEQIKINKPSLISIECQHIAKKIDCILSEMKFKKYSNEEKNLF